MPTEDLIIQQLTLLAVAATAVASAIPNPRGPAVSWRFECPPGTVVSGCDTSTREGYGPTGTGGYYPTGTVGYSPLDTGSYNYYYPGYYPTGTAGYYPTGTGGYSGYYPTYHPTGTAGYYPASTGYCTASTTYNPSLRHQPKADPFYSLIFYKNLNCAVDPVRYNGDPTILIEWGFQNGSSIEVRRRPMATRPTSQP
jgi:hypothetical protein